MFQVCLSNIWLNGKDVGNFWLAEKELCGWRDLGNRKAPNSALQIIFKNNEYQGCKPLQAERLQHFWRKIVGNK